MDSKNFISIIPKLITRLELTLHYIGSDNVSEETSTVLLEPGSDDKWDIEYVEEDKLVKITGKIANIYEFVESTPVQQYTGGISSLTYKDTVAYKIVVDTSTQYSSKLVDIHYSQIRTISKVIETTTTTETPTSTNN